MQSKRQRIRDPLHDLIEFGCEPFERTLWRVVQTPSFQRLRRVKQLGFSEYVYPGATHTRFSHSLGVYHIAKKLVRVIEARSKNGQFDKRLAEEAIAAALVHDVGHGPFSHAFEEVGKKLNLKMAKHEDLSDEIVRKGDIGEVLDKYNNGLSGNVADIIKAPSHFKIYGAVVSSQFDADRLDYMQRDRLMTGTQLGKIDFAWLMANLEIGDVPWGVAEDELGEKQTFVLGTKSIQAAEAYVLGLFQLYPTVYYHKATRGAEKLFTELMLRIFALARNGDYAKTNLSENHQLIVFAKEPDVLKNAQSLDDSVIMGALALMAEAKDPLISDFSQRLQARRLYKCIDVRERLLQMRIEVEKIPLALKAIQDKIQDWLQGQDANAPTRILIDEGMREPYKLFEEEKGPFSQIMIQASTDRIVDINEQSAIIRAISPFEFFRVYTADDDTKAKTFVENAIKEG